jgi:hypothetical protein
MNRPLIFSNLKLKNKKKKKKRMEMKVAVDDRNALGAQVEGQLSYPIFLSLFICFNLLVKVGFVLTINCNEC